MLNPQLDVPALAAQFKIKHRIQVRNALQPEIADRLLYCLEHEVPWGVAYLEGKEPALIMADTLTGYTQTDWHNLHRKVQETRPDEFQFLYSSYMMVTAYLEKRDPHLLLHRVVEYINSNLFLDFLKGVSGVENIIKADAQATRYMPGCFLKKHDDTGKDATRRVAYVINLTKGWRADWGGLLQFLDEEGMVTETFNPVFNSLTLFKVPMSHHVSYTAPYAPHGRYAITGWGMSR